MKKLLFGLISLTVMNLMFVSCEQVKTDTAPELPPVESMIGNLSDFNIENDTKSTSSEFNSVLEESMLNFSYARLNVAYFNLFLSGALVVPVAAFKTAFTQKAVFLGDATWEWTYTVDGFGGAYSARLTGTVMADKVHWEMYLQRNGIQAFPEFLWFEGNSDLDGMGGNWLLYHSYEFQDPMLQIDWERTGDEVGDISFTYVREKNNEGIDEASKGSFIKAGKTDSELNAFYDIHVYVENEEDFVDINIEWSTSEYFGRVNSNIYLGGAWQCWDNMGYDTICTE